jgi:putative ATP-dependent endonuclease of OLD family
MEAIHLALSGVYCGKNICNEISQYLFNSSAVNAYIQSVNEGSPLPPPSILIEIYFDGSIDPAFEGNNNTDKAISVEGVKFEITYNSKYDDEYEKLISQRSLVSMPIEYYEAIWTAFSRNPITIRSIPIKSAMIDSSTYRYQNGSDVYISRIVKDLLSPEEVTAVAQAHRNMKDTFIGDSSIRAINTRISAESSIIDGKVSLSVDLGTKNAWEGSLVTQLNDIPFGFIGKGAQCVLKTELALAHRQAQNAQVILLEEPESHLSFSKLNQLISAIEKKYDGKQIIISTHSSFVANKLGLNNLLLLENNKVTKITDLPSANFFKKISGYDTLRMLLCKKAILVEGDSDELIIQKAYIQQHDGRLPIEDQIDVISVGISFLRFLEIADALHLDVAVVTDNDGNIEALERKYSNYLGANKKDNIEICYDKTIDSGDLRIGDAPYNYNTLEPKMIKANNSDLSLFNTLFSTGYTEIDELRKYMKHHKTECALAVFESDEAIKFPEYILEAIRNG